METLSNFAFCLVMDGADDMTIPDAEYNITCWKEEGMPLPKNITASSLVREIDKIKKYMEGAKNNV